MSVNIAYLIGMSASCLLLVLGIMVNTQPKEGYTKAERKAHQLLVQRVLAEYNPRARALEDVWGITPEEADKPVRIFTKNSNY